MTCQNCLQSWGGVPRSRVRALWHFQVAQKEQFQGNFGPAWAILGPSWGHLGAVLGHGGAILGYDGASLGRSWRQSLLCSHCRSDAVYLSCTALQGRLGVVGVVVGRCGGGHRFARPGRPGPSFAASKSPEDEGWRMDMEEAGRMQGWGKGSLFGPPNDLSRFGPPKERSTARKVLFFFLFLFFLVSTPPLRRRGQARTPPTRCRRRNPRRPGPPARAAPPLRQCAFATRPVLAARSEGQVHVEVRVGGWAFLASSRLLGASSSQPPRTSDQNAPLTSDVELGRSPSEGECRGGARRG